MPRFLQDAVKTEIGYAHPLTGEQLTANKGLTGTVDYYDPNSGVLSFIDPAGEIDGLVMFQSNSKDSLVASFAFHTNRTDVTQVDWDFGDSVVINDGGFHQKHAFSSAGIYTVEATATFEDTSTANYTVSFIAGLVAPSNTVLSTITGTAQVGQTLTAVNGTWTGSPTITFTYQWKKGGVDISGATSSTYVPEVGDIGETITVTVTGTNAGGAASATSAATAAVIAA